jgi:hypothetical protein
LTALLAALSLPAAAGTISGHVRNGSNGKPVPHAEVALISLVNGMEPLTTTQTDAEGGFSFDRPEIGRGPMLVRTTYQGAGYFQMSPPGRPVADLEVFEANAPASAVHLASRTLIFQPNGARLMAVEDYVLQNSANPPATYNNPKGAFEFEVPAGAKMGQVTATPPGGMPLPQGTTDRGKNRYAVDFPIKPGETAFRIAYDLPYEGDKADFRAPSILPADRVMLAAPVGMTISADGFTPGGTEQGYTLVVKQHVAAGSPLAISLSGTAPMPPEPGESARGGAAGGGRDAGASPGENLQVLAPRLASFQWIVLGGMGVFFVLGFIYLMRSPAAAGQPGIAGHSMTAGSPQAVAAAGAESAGSGRANKPRAAAQAPAAPAASGASSGAILAEAERAAQLNLEELKDKLFRLELRHQAGTITEEDYARERGRLQTILRDLVHG